MRWIFKRSKQSRTEFDQADQFNQQSQKSPSWKEKFRIKKKRNTQQVYRVGDAQQDTYPTGLMTSPNHQNSHRPITHYPRDIYRPQAVNSPSLARQSNREPIARLRSPSPSLASYPASYNRSTASRNDDPNDKIELICSSPIPYSPYETSPIPWQVRSRAQDAHTYQHHTTTGDAIQQTTSPTSKFCHNNGTGSIASRKWKSQDQRHPGLANDHGPQRQVQMRTYREIVVPPSQAHGNLSVNGH